MKNICVETFVYFLNFVLKENFSTINLNENIARRISFTTRMHSSRMRTARSSSRSGGLHQAPPGSTPPGADPPKSTPPPGPGTPLLQGMLGYHLQCMLG